MILGSGIGCSYRNIASASTSWSTHQARHRAAHAVRARQGPQSGFQQAKSPHPSGRSPISAIIAWYASAVSAKFRPVRRLIPSYPNVPERPVQPAATYSWCPSMTIFGLSVQPQSCRKAQSAGPSEHTTAKRAPDAATAPPSTTAPPPGQPDQPQSAPLAAPRAGQRYDTPPPARRSHGAPSSRSAPPTSAQWTATTLSRPFQDPQGASR